MEKSNRVDSEHTELMKNIANEYLNIELANLNTLFAKLLPDGIEWKDSSAKRAQDIRAQMQLIKDMCQWASGAVHPSMSNTKEERKG